MWQETETRTWENQSEQVWKSLNFFLFTSFMDGLQPHEYLTAKNLKLIEKKENTLDFYIIFFGTLKLLGRKDLFEKW